MNRNLLLVTASLFTWGLGESGFLYFQTLYLRELGADPLLIGGILSAVGFAMAAFQIPAGYLADRWGQRPMMWISWVVGAASAWLMALAPSLLPFFIGLLLYNLTSYVLAPMNSYITAVRGEWSPARALTLASGGFHLGSAGGPLLAGIIASRYGLRMVYVFGSVILLLSVVLILLIQRAPTEPHTIHTTERSNIFRNRRLLLLACSTLLTMFVLYLPQPLTSNYLVETKQLNYEQIGLLGMVASLGNALALFSLGSLPPLAGFLLGQSLALLFSLLLWRGSGLFWFAGGYFFLSGYRLCRSMVTALARSFVPAQQTGLAFGLLETCNAIAIIIAPLLAGWLFSQQPAAIYILALLGGLVVFLLNWTITRPALLHPPQPTVTLHPTPEKML